MTFLSGVLVGAVLAVVAVVVVLRKWPTQADDFMEYLRK